MTGWLRDKATLVTGAASGIGEAVADRFVDEGARVCAFDRDAAGLERLAARHPQHVVTVAGDVRSWDDNRRAVRTAADAFGRLDVFVANAGVGDAFVRLVDLAPDELERAFDEIFGVDVKGYLLGARAAVPALVQTGGCMILTASSAGVFAGTGGVLYTAAKHAVVGLIRQLAHELAPKVRVNGVAPGGTLTGMQPAPSLRDRGGPRPETSRAERIRVANPLGLAMRPSDHTAAYVLLASDQARAMTGVVLESDGGLRARGLWDVAGGRDL
ncbi:MAG: SDR family oxidoreductase [Armatimonadota bacterium]|nr:SDR family oxidoreductase [Armatimonadota bacterium]